MRVHRCMRAGMNIYWTNINNKNIAFVWYKCLQWNSIFYAVKLRQEPLRDKPAMMMSHTKKYDTVLTNGKHTPVIGYGAKDEVCFAM